MSKHQALISCTSKSAKTYEIMLVPCVPARGVACGIEEYSSFAELIAVLKRDFNQTARDLRRLFEKPNWILCNCNLSDAVVERFGPLED
jgi:hypothetical protein